MVSKIVDWFTYRWPFKPVIRWSLEEEIPGGDSFWYSFGATTLFVFVLQVLTGIWQLFYYVPTIDHAYQSVSYLRYQVSFGWLIHGLHYWGSNAFIVIVFIHILRVFIWGAYKAPRQLTWLVGVFLLFLVLSLSFTGALLPWDELGYWAAEVGTSIAGTIPKIGFFIKEFMRGGSSMDQLTLSRFFVAHVAILPGILAALIVFHVVSFRQFKSVGPWNEKKREKTGYFWPQQVVKDLIVISAVFILLIGLSAFWPAPVTGPADALDNTVTPKPEWQFLFLYQFLKLFKGRLEPVGTVGIPLVLFLIFFLLPFYDRNKKRNPLYRPVAMLVCIALVVWFLVYTILGYYSKPGASLTGKVTVSSQASASSKAGAKLFSSQGCIACHTVNGQGGNIGPNLSNEGSKGLSDKWLTVQIRNPKSHDPSTAMPAFDSLSDQQVKHLVDFLQSLGGSPSKSKSSQPAESNKPAAAESPKEPNAAPVKSTAHPNEPSASSKSKPIPAQTSFIISEGKSLFNSQGCINCHTIDGKGGKVGPSLSDIGSEDKSDQWIEVQIKDPKKHNASSIMPSFDSLNEKKVKALVAYLQSRKESSKSDPPQKTDSNDPPDANRPPLPNPAGKTDPSIVAEAAYLVGNPSHGKELFNRQCMRCHGKDGKDNVPNPGSNDGTVPPLNPIDREIYNQGPVTFAENIDRFIQHGSVPAGPSPQKTMPAFGDDHMLTQQMIAQIQAYILKLNKVNRAEILNPGLQPYAFFASTLAVFGAAVLIIIILWANAKGDFSKTTFPTKPHEKSPSPETLGGKSDKEKTAETAHQNVAPEKDRGRDILSTKSRLTFTIIVIIVVAVIAASVMLIFSSFATIKPVPSIPTNENTSTGPNGSSDSKQALPVSSPSGPSSRRPDISEGSSRVEDTIYS